MNVAIGRQPQGCLTAAEIFKRCGYAITYYEGSRRNSRTREHAARLVQQVAKELVEHEVSCAQCERERLAQSERIEAWMRKNKLSQVEEQGNG